MSITIKFDNRKQSISFFEAVGMKHTVAALKAAERRELRRKNIYQRLEATGWQRTNGNARLDFYHKKNWTCIVPSSTIGKVRFIRSK